VKADGNTSRNKVYRGGHVVGPEAALTFAGLATMALPGEIHLHYDDVRTTIVFQADSPSNDASMQNSRLPEVTSPNTRASVQDNSSSVGIGATRSLSQSEQIIMEGMVWKRSRHLHRWHQRQLVLTERAVMSFKEGRVMTMNIPAGTARRVKIADSSRPACLCIEADSGDFILSCDTQNETYKWLEELSRVLLRVS